MKNLLACIFILLILSSCQNNKENTAQIDVKNDTLVYQYDSVKVYSKNIPKGKQNLIDTPKASITFPVFKNDTLNQFIKRKVFDYIAKEEPITPYKDMMSSFIKGYDDFVQSNPETPQSWFLIIKINVLRQSSNYISLKYIHSDYVGGAHGYTGISFLNYNPKTNQPVTLDSLIQKDKMNVLLAIAEGIFRKNEKLTPTQSLEESYFFEKGKFALAQSYYVSNKGLVFLYNPYEIKAYAEGYTELVVPFSALKDIAKPQTILTTTTP